MPSNPVIEGDLSERPEHQRRRLQRRPARRLAPHRLGRGQQHRLRALRRDAAHRYDVVPQYRRRGDMPHTDTSWHAASETVWNMNTDTFRTLGDTSADAAGLSILAGLVRPDEGLPVADGGQGAINHALRFTLPSEQDRSALRLPGVARGRRLHQQQPVAHGRTPPLAEQRHGQQPHQPDGPRGADHRPCHAAVWAHPGGCRQQHVHHRLLRHEQRQQPDSVRLEHG